MSESNEEWELSKENIKPIQQGRKQNVLKVALAPHPDDVIAHQRQLFESELRTYSGNDPLAIWCKYIKWVEQNYPKGGREGHIKKLLEQCLSIFKDDKKYFDDPRFVDILLKYAGLSGKPVEVYNYMYSCNIGCKSAKFFINWSWELEELGNLKKADEVLTEGIQRQAEPFEKIQSYQKDFEIRLANKLKANAVKNDMETENSRSAFAVLKPQKKNLAPIMRTGDVVVGNKSSLILDKQPQPRSSAPSGKVPFKIYNSENVNPFPPTQSAVRKSFNLENYKENEQKPIKWNKFKVKSHTTMPSEVTPDFKFHCDEECDQQIRTPRSVPKTSNILSTRHRTPSPRIALFEPEDPLKKPMYPKNKVYGGAVEYSLEEIRAAEWHERKKKAVQDKLLEERQKKIEVQQKEIEFLTKKLQLLESKVADSASIGKVPDISLRKDTADSLENNCQKNESNDILLNNYAESVNQAQNNGVPNQNIKCQLNSRTQLKDNSGNTKNCNYGLTETFESKGSKSASYYDKMIQELYNRTLPNSTDEEENKKLSKINQVDVLHGDDKLPFAFYQDPTEKIPDSKEASSREFLTENSLSNVKTSNQLGKTQTISKDSNKIPFSFYQDPTENIFNSSELKQIDKLQSNSHESSNKLPFISHQGSIKIVSHSREVEPTEELPSISKDKVPFTFYQDTTENILNSREVNQTNQSYHIVKDSQKLPFAFFHDSTETLPKTNENATVKGNEAKEEFQSELHEISSEEEAENIPPKGYVQEKKQRELAGILQPSTNVLFIPLEQQELEEESDIEDDCIYQNRQHHTDDTLIPLSNTEQFSASKFLTSTPYIPRTSKSSDCEDSHQEIPSSDRKKMENSEISTNARKEFVSDENFSNKLESNLFKEPALSAEMKSTCYPRLPNMLSVIMETSRENYSKSSSSSSCASLTKSNHLEQYSSQHSSLHKNSSKLETCEANAVNSVFEVSNHNCDTNFPNINFHKDNNGVIKEKIQLYTANFDPYDQNIIQELLKSIKIYNYQNIFCVKKSMRVIKVGENILIGKSMYMIENLIAEGAYAKVYKAVIPSLTPFVASSNYSNGKLALKACKKGTEWEFYICCEIQKRLEESKFLPDIKNSVMKVITAIKYTDGILLVTEYGNLGTLLDVVNFYKKQCSAIPEFIVMYFTLEMLHIVSKLHKCNIIHGDIKPDNFLLNNDNLDIDVLEKKAETSCLKLIDFGRAIDLSLFNKGVCFTTVFSAKHLQCNEMKEEKPWAFQLDWYGVLSCLHTMLFSEYMVTKKTNGIWGIEKKFKRYWFTSLWEPLFNQLLNIPDCYVEPDVSSFISMIESKLQQNSATFLSQLVRFSSTYSVKT